MARFNFDRTRKFEDLWDRLDGILDDAILEDLTEAIDLYADNEAATRAEVEGDQRFADGLIAGREECEASHGD